MESIHTSSIVHLIDSLGIGGRQILLETVMRESLRVSQAQLRLVSLFGDGPMSDRYRELGVPVDIIDIRSDLDERRLDRAVRRLTSYFREHNPDIVEAHLTYSRLIGLFAAWRAGVPVRIAFEPGDIYLDSWKFRIANFGGQFLADRIVPCSNALADWNHRTHGIFRRRMEVIHNCVDLNRFDPERVKASGIPFDRPACETLYCAIGTLGTGVNKRMDICIRAIAEARAQGGDVGLVIVGDGPLRAELELLVQELGLAQHVRLLGTRTDTPEILGACDAFCHAAPFEPFGIVAIEAMAMELPIVVPNSGGIREVVVSEQTGLLYPALDHLALAGHMVRLHREGTFRRQMGRIAREEAIRRFSPHRYVTDLCRLINDIETGKQP